MKKNGLLSVEAISRIVGLDDNLIMDYKEMAKQLKVTFFPYEGKASQYTREFYSKLKDAFISNGVTVVPFKEARMKLNHNKIKKGIHLIVLGDQDVKNMPAEYLVTYDSLILTIVDDEKYIAEDYMHKTFKEQADYGQALLTWHFSNFVVGVDKENWISYEATGNNGVYKTDYEGTFNNDVLKAIIAKMYAPIRPTPLSEFKIDKKGFEEDDENFKLYLDDLAEGSKLLAKTKLMDYHYSVDDVKFKKEAYKKIYSIMLDHRTGIHFGYISRQLPTALSKVYKLSEAKEELKIEFGEKDYTVLNDDIYIKLKIKEGDICLKVPEIKTLTSISGANKINLEYKDIVKMGLKNGNMSLQFAKGVNPKKNNVRASFDTKVILSNAVSTAIYASVLKYTNPKAVFPSLLENKGIALIHWHGYVNPKLIPMGWEVYGSDFPVFMCSAQQAAVYGFIGKSQAFMKHIDEKQEYELCGDIHIEPDHGVNLTWESVINAANFFLDNPEVASVGIEYLPLIKDSSTISPIYEIK